MKKLVIVDYGMGNLQSVKNALSSLGQACEISSDINTISNADAYMLPGVGAFPKAMKNLEKQNLIQVLTENVLKKKKPFLGICLGMQLIASHSDEFGGHEGLGWIPAKVIALNPESGIKVPHVGWNDLTILRPGPILKNIENGSNFYFDHSFHFVCDEKYIGAMCGYGKPLVACVQNENIFGAQFHPEKSQTAGLKFLRNFLNVVDQCLKKDS